jgi:hypothetical protein
MTGSSCKRPPISSSITVPRKKTTDHAASRSPSQRRAMRAVIHAVPAVAQIDGTRIQNSDQPESLPNTAASQYTSGGLSG